MIHQAYRICNTLIGENGSRADSERRECQIDQQHAHDNDHADDIAVLPRRQVYRADVLLHPDLSTLALIVTVHEVHDQHFKRPQNGYGVQIVHGALVAAEQRVAGRQEHETAIADDVEYHDEACAVLRQAVEEEAAEYGRQNRQCNQHYEGIQECLETRREEVDQRTNDGGQHREDDADILADLDELAKYEKQIDAVYARMTDENADKLYGEIDGINDKITEVLERNTELWDRVSDEYDVKVAANDPDMAF